MIEFPLSEEEKEFFFFFWVCVENFGGVRNRVKGWIECRREWKERNQCSQIKGEDELNFDVTVLPLCFF